MVHFLIKVSVLFGEPERKRFVTERREQGSQQYVGEEDLLACQLTHRWTVCQRNLTHTDRRLPSRPAEGGNGTEREEEEREKELITTLMLHFIIVS